MAQPLMPHATAAWLVDNTLAHLRADRRVLRSSHPRGAGDRRRYGGDQADRPRPDPRRRADPRGDREGAEAIPTTRSRCTRRPKRCAARKGPRYTPVSKRQDKPDGIAWIIKNHPEVSDGQISKLIGTTRTTIAAIRDRTHWNMANITPKDPVTLGLTTQRELDAAVAKAAKAAGVAAPTDTRLDSDREALIEQLRREREQHAREAEAALADAGDEALRDEIVPGIRDPFKNTPDRIAARLI